VKSLERLGTDGIFSNVQWVGHIESWMTANRLKMNTDKTDFIWLGSKHQLAKIQLQSIALEAVHVPVHK